MSSNPAMPSGPEATVGKYRLLRRIASGGMAEVYLATDDGKSLWAVKLMLPHLADHSEFLGLFLDEARLASQINHPNVARVRDMGMENGRLFLAMEYARGQPLSALLQKLKEKGSALSPAQAAAIVAQSAAGLNAAHEAKARDGTPMELVHRDVSPQNLLLTEDGMVKVVDFGIAKARNKLVVTQVNTTRGKPWYMSPEQMRGEKLDRRADVFSLGAVLFELLLGSRLFEGDVDQVMYKALNEPLPDILKLKPDVPHELAEMIKRACARKPDDRFETAWEMEQELKGFAAANGGGGDLGALVRDNFPRMPATVDEVLGPTSRPSMRSGPSRPISRPATGARQAVTPSGPPVKVRRPGTAAPTVGEAPPVEDTPIDKVPEPAPEPARPARPPTPRATVMASAPASSPAPAEVPDDAVKVRTEIPKRDAGKGGGSKAPLFVGIGVVVLCFGVGIGAAWHFMQPKPAPPPPPRPPPPSLLAPVTPPPGTEPAKVVKAEPAPVPVPVPEVASNTGKVRVTCSADYGCDVYVDGQARDSAPCELKLAPGKHVIAARWGSMSRPRGHAEVIRKGAITVLHFGELGETQKNMSAAGEMMDARNCSGKCRIEHLNHALSRDADNPAAQKLLGETWAEQGRYDLARFYLQNYLDIAKNPPDFEAVFARISEYGRK